MSNLEFKDPVEMLYVLDEDIYNGHYELYPWQARILLDFAKPSTSEKPFKATARICNGGGKDRMIIAPAAAWLASSHEDTQVVITSASGQQLDRQTGNYLARFLTTANQKVGTDLWQLNYRHYINKANRSEITMFATDEAGKAEGWHPLKPGAQFAIFVSEAKSVEEDIFTALHRCTGFTKRIDASTPALPQGSFYANCVSDYWTHYHFTAFDCPHLSQEYINETRDNYGENHWLYRSMILAEFGTTDEFVVIPYLKLYNMIKNPPEWIPEPFNNAGLDLSAGGDEQVLIIRNGNRVLQMYCFRFDDTAALVDHLIDLFKLNSLNNNVSKIYADAGGLGKPILDQLVQRGWSNIVYMLNNYAPVNTLAYYNLGSEIWFRLVPLVERQALILPDDEKLKRQLSSRYYRVAEKNRIALESKIQAKAKGHPSPDRADALVLSFTNYSCPLILAPRSDSPLTIVSKPKPVMGSFHPRYHQDTLPHLTKVDNKDWLISELNMLNQKIRSN